jgi:LPXTG-motif cell wall-anchored protein
MYRAWHLPARRSAVLLALILVTFGFASPGPAFAEPGNGQGTPPPQAATPAPPAAVPAPAAPAPAAPAASDQGGDTAQASGGRASGGRASGGQASGGQASGHASGGTSGTSGDPTQPQPVSGADDNAGGANGQCTGGEYCSTRDGSPSGNGNDVGEATGKPCAGCVGKADNKNPPGQMPNAADDGNSGYECDTNNGIGKGKDGQSAGNPAHTGCVTPTDSECVPEPGQDADCTTPSTAPCVPTPGQTGTCETPPCVPSEANDLCGTSTAPVCVPTAENDYCAEVLGDEETAPPATNPGNNRPPVVAGVEQLAQPAAAAVQPASGVLPNTGASTLLNALSAAGIGLLLVGGLTLLMQRKLVRG